VSDERTEVEQLREEVTRWKVAHESLERENQELRDEIETLRKREFGPMTRLAMDIAQELKDQFFTETTPEERRALLKKGAEMLRERLKNFGKKKGD
jgi:hypothetical protein